MALWVYASVKTWEDGGSNLGTANFFWTRRLEKRRMVRLQKQTVGSIEKRSMQRREDDGRDKNWTQNLALTHYISLVRRNV